MAPWFLRQNKGFLSTACIPGPILPREAAVSTLWVLSDLLVLIQSTKSRTRPYHTLTVTGTKCRRCHHEYYLNAPHMAKCRCGHETKAFSYFSGAYFSRTRSRNRVYFGLRCLMCFLVIFCIACGQATTMSQSGPKGCVFKTVYQLYVG